MTQEQYLSAGLVVFLISCTFIETFLNLCRYKHIKNLVYQKYIFYIAIDLWIGECMKVKPDGSCHYEAAKTQSGIYALVGSAVSHFADNIYPSKKCTDAWR